MRTFIFLIWSISINACGTVNSGRQFITTSEMVRILSSDDFEGRQPGTPGFEEAAIFIENCMKELKIKPLFNNSYPDTLSVFGTKSYNIVGVIESGQSTGDYILLGAHLDHLGKMPSKTDSVYNGANDNASGVTAVLQIAKELRKYRFDKKVIIAVFTGEESGKWGSEHLAQRLKKAGIKLSYVLNFEMIGTPLTSLPGKVYITGFNRSDFAEVANKLIKEEFVVFEKAELERGLFYGSDNYPFYLEYKIPSHTISTFDFRNYRYYHNLQDEYSKLDIRHMDTIINKVTRLLVNLLESNSVITLKN
jgi:Zn-dependent M28 family amino/carboxypeptidase